MGQKGFGTKGTKRRWKYASSKATFFAGRFLEAIMVFGHLQK